MIITEMSGMQDVCIGNNILETSSNSFINKV